ncbi:MAG: penicillin-binding protein activator LpoB [Hyphomicrobiales bacterium]
MIKQAAKIALFTLLTLSFVSCTTRKVTRVSSEQQIDLSGRWNSTDAQQTADAMIAQALGERWIADFQQQNNGKKPVVIVGFVKNKTSEHIDSELFIKDLEKAFINSGRVRLVMGGQQREEIRGERADQQNFSSEESMKKWGKEIGADFMLQGTMGSITDSYKNERVIYYQIDLTLANLETNEVVWIGDKKIKKYINN